jgi:hypothetical protein
VRGGVRHGLVEEQPVEVVAEVVVGRYAIARAFNGVAVPASRDALNRGDQWAQQLPHVVEQGDVARRETYDADEVIGVPEAGGVTFSEADTPSQERPVGRLVVYADVCSERISGVEPPECVDPVTFVNTERPASDLGE